MATRAGRVRAEDIQIGKNYYLVRDIVGTTDISKIVVTEFHRSQGLVSFLWQRFDLNEQEPRLHHEDETLAAFQLAMRVPSRATSELRRRGRSFIRLSSLIHGDPQERSGVHFFTTLAKARRYIEEHQQVCIQRVIEHQKKQINKDFEGDVLNSVPKNMEYVNIMKPPVLEIVPLNLKDEQLLAKEMEEINEAGRTLRNQDLRREAAISGTHDHFKLSPDFDLE